MHESERRAKADKKNALRTGFAYLCLLYYFEHVSNWEMVFYAISFGFETHLPKLTETLSTTICGLKGFCLQAHQPCYISSNEFYSEIKVHVILMQL